MSQNALSLKVLEAYTRDVGRGVARIDYDSMDTLNASTGDVLTSTDATTGDETSISTK